MEEYDEDLVGVYRAGSHEMGSWMKNITFETVENKIKTK